MKLINRNSIRIYEGASDWKEAIRLSTMSLEEQGFVEPRYKEEIIANVERLGPYIVIMPQVALPHARPEQGVISSQVSFTLFRSDVSFSKEHEDVRLFITLAAQDNDGHIEALVAVTELLQNEEKLVEIMNAKNEDELYKLIQEGE